MSLAHEALDTELLEKKSNHRANLVRITEILPHTNADKLEIIKIDGYQVVVQKGRFEAGSLAVYIQPDSVVPQTEPFWFIWGPHEITSAVPGVPSESIVSAKRRRITVRKFRGEWSEGLLMPVSDFGLIPAPDDVIRIDDFSSSPARAIKHLEFRVGDDLSEFLNITHYEPEEETGDTHAAQSAAPRIRPKRPRTLKGWFFYILNYFSRRRAQKYHDGIKFHIPVYDVDALKNHLYAFEPGEAVAVTEKIHGSNARYLFLDGTMYAGSHRRWVAPGPGIFRDALISNPWIEEWCRAHEGYVLYGEVAPTQKRFDYGATKSSPKVFIFDIRDPNGNWVPFDQWYTAYSELHTVPLLYYGLFDLDAIKSHVDGKSVVDGANHLREGVVVGALNERSVRGHGRLKLKIVSNAFMDKDSKAA